MTKPKSCDMSRTPGTLRVPMYTVYTSYQSRGDPATVATAVRAQTISKPLIYMLRGIVHVVHVHVHVAALN